MKQTLLFLFILSFAFSASADIVDSFETSKNQIILERGDFAGGGRTGARIPYVKSKPVLDPERGTVLEMDFNVSQGYGGTYLKFNTQRFPQHFNRVSFWLRGVPSTFKIEVKDPVIHMFIVNKSERSDWRKITIPIREFSNSDSFTPKNMNEFVFVFEDHRTSPRLGKIYVDDLAFTWESDKSPSAVMAVPSAVSTRQTEKGILDLTGEVARLGTFSSFRFEASWDGRHWFLVKEFSDPEQKQFAYSWNVSRYLGGTYFLRAVTVDEFGNRREGEKSKVQLESQFDVNAFLDEVQERTFDYFMNEVDSWTYLMKDRTVQDSVLSTGLSGFQFTAYVIGVERGWMEREEAVKRMNHVLDFFLNELERYHGLVPHWLRQNRKEVWEIGMGDVVETTFILAGALTAQQYFDRNNPGEKAFRRKVDQFYSEIKWNELLKRAKAEDEKGLLPWHWSKKAGASKLEVRGYNEATIVYLMGLGAPNYTLPPESWKAWASSYQKGRYGPYELIACAPLFTHQYSHLWVDFRNLRDAYGNYFENSVLATLANREYSLKANDYPPEIWGLTASEGPNHYKAYGSPPVASSVPVINDGTIAPTAAATSIMFTPPLSIAAMKHMRDEYGYRLWGKYGFKDAFNPKTNWFTDLYLGLDQGPLLIGIENYRTGLIWKLFMKNPHIQKGLTAAGFKKDISPHKGGREHMLE